MLGEVLGDLWSIHACLLFVPLPVSYDFSSNLTRYWLGDFDRVFIIQFLKSNVNFLYPQVQPPSPQIKIMQHTSLQELPLCVAVQLPRVLLCSDANKVTVIRFNLLMTTLYLSDLKTQFVPRSKHSLPRLYKPIS